MVVFLPGGRRGVPSVGFSRAALRRGMRISRQELQEIRELPDASEVDHLRELDLSNKVGGRAQSRVVPSHTAQLLSLRTDRRCGL